MDIDSSSLKDLFELDECATKRVIIFDNSNYTLNNIVKQGIQTSYRYMDLRGQIDLISSLFDSQERTVVVVNEDVDINTLPTQCKKYFTLFIRRINDKKYYMISYVDNLCS